MQELYRPINIRLLIVRHPRTKIFDYISNGQLARLDRNFDTLDDPLNYEANKHFYPLHPSFEHSVLAGDYVSDQ